MGVHNLDDITRRQIRIVKTAKFIYTGKTCNPSTKHFVVDHRVIHSLRVVYLSNYALLRGNGRYNC